MSRHLSSKTSDLTQKLSRQFTTKNHRSNNDNKRNSEEFNKPKKQPLKVKEKYRNWALIDKDDDYDDYEA